MAKEHIWDENELHIGFLDYEESEKSLDGFTWYNARKSPITLHGLYKPQEAGDFKRLPLDVASATGNASAEDLGRQPAGGRVRFMTDSAVVGVRMNMRKQAVGWNSSVFVRVGAAVYTKNDFGKDVYAGAIKPAWDTALKVCDKVNLGNKGKMKEVCIYLPLSVYVSDIEIAIEADAKIQKARDYTISKPIVFYGSSITQGYSASTPAYTYEAFISRDLDCDYHSLGFSGNAKGEECVAQFVSTMEMSAFVLDYDHNAPTVEHLQDTHYNFYETVRKANPDLPIIMCTKPDFHRDNHTEHLRRCVVMETYIKARRQGDTNVYFVDGASMFRNYDFSSCTFDGCHPNDLGMRLMADAIGTVLKNVVKK